jgi:hypothetical protein
VTVRARATRRHDFLLRRRRGLVDWLVLIFICISLAAGIAWLAHAGYRELHPPDYRDGLDYEPIWQ